MGFGAGALLGLIYNQSALQRFVLIWLGCTSLMAFVAFAMDKQAARTKQRRIPEITLLNLVGIGGIFGGLLGMYGLRHKTQKRSFIVPFWLIIGTFIIAWSLATQLFRYS